VQKTHNKSVKPFACGSLGRSALSTYSGMASAFSPSNRSMLDAAYLGVEHQVKIVGKNEDFL